MAKGSWLVLAFIVSTTVQAQRSPFNGLEVLPADTTGHYRILIGGHFHGESTNRSGYPASTLLANLDTINALGANLFLSTGDLFMDPVKDMPRYQRALFSRLKMPLFNAPGNHDLSSGASQRVPSAYSIAIGYLPALSSEGLDHIRSGLSRLNGDARDTAFQRAGRTLFQEAQAFDADSLSVGLGACVVLDLESSGGKLTSKHLQELDFWAKSLTDPEAAKLMGNRLFIISHRPIWAEDDPQYSSLFEGNTRSLTGTNFKKDVHPLLEKIAEHAHVYWISGSMGGFAPSSIFFQEHSKNITFIQCAIRDEPRDALLIADVFPDTIEWSALSLTGQKLLAPEEYDAAWWREHLKKGAPGFNWRLLPYLIKTTVLRREFWWGMLGGALLLILLRRLIRR